MNSRKRLCFGVAFGVVAAWAPLWAEDQDPPRGASQGAFQGTFQGAPREAGRGEGGIDLEADSIHYDRNTGRSVYRGNVVVRRDDVHLTGDEVEVFSEAGEISRITARANPSTFESRSEEGLIRAEADVVEYDVKRRVIVFLGNARVDDGEKVLRGGRIVYDLEKRIVDATKSKGRVRLTIDP